MLSRLAAHVVPFFGRLTVTADPGARLEPGSILVTELAVETIFAKTVDEAYAGDQLVTVRLRAVDRRIRDVQGTLARLGAQGDPEQLAAVQNELWVLTQYGQSLRNNGAAAL